MGCSVLIHFSVFHYYSMKITLCDSTPRPPIDV
jgi:hypothetical protein